MDSTGQHPSPLRVAAVVSFYMFAALVVRLFIPSPQTLSPMADHVLISPRWFSCTLLSVDLLACILADYPTTSKEQGGPQFFAGSPAYLLVSATHHSGLASSCSCSILL